jgi:hypothetical protein
MAGEQALGQRFRQEFGLVAPVKLAERRRGRLRAWPAARCGVAAAAMALRENLAPIGLPS